MLALEHQIMQDVECMPSKNQRKNLILRMLRRQMTLMDNIANQNHQFLTSNP
jgi:hypothetical protein